MKTLLLFAALLNFSFGSAMQLLPMLRDVCRERCDVLERNWFYDGDGRLVFEQIIFLDVEGDVEQVRAWRLVKSSSQVPQRDWTNGGYVMFWLDGELSREVRAPWYRESWTQHDPELAARESLPKEKRKELRTR